MVMRFHQKNDIRTIFNAQKLCTMGTMITKFLEVVQLISSFYKNQPVYLHWASVASFESQKELIYFLQF